MNESPKPPPPPVRPPKQASRTDLPPRPPAADADARAASAREPARDTLAPSSFGVVSGNKSSSPVRASARSPRAPMPTLGELETASATATLRPPGAVPPPPRALPGAVSPFESGTFAGAAPVEEAPVERATEQAPPHPEPSRPEPSHSEAATAPTAPSAPKAPAPSAVPAPGLFIADEPLEPRPRQQSLVTVRRDELTRLRVGVFGLGAVLVLLGGVLTTLVLRRSALPLGSQSAAPSAAPAAITPGCSIVSPPSRISPIERGVPISALALPDGNLLLGIADAKSSASGFVYDPAQGEIRRRFAGKPGSGDISHVSASDPLGVDRTLPDFAFAQTLVSGVSLGVGPSGILRRGDDGATGVVWPLPGGVRVTPPRALAMPDGHFVAFRQGGAEGQIIAGWLAPDGAAKSPAAAIAGAPASLGTPTVAALGSRAVVLFPARADKAEPYAVYAAVAAPGEAAAPAQRLDTPADGSGAIAPSLVALNAERLVLQWTDGNPGQYQVHVRVLDAALKPASEALLVSAKGANAGQGAIFAAGSALVSFFIQTTAGHDELWGVTLKCR